MWVVVGRTYKYSTYIGLHRPESNNFISGEKKVLAGEKFPTRLSVARFRNFWKSKFKTVVSICLARNVMTRKVMWLNKREPANYELLFQSRIHNMTTKDIIPRKTKCAVSYTGRLTMHTKPTADARNKDGSVRTENGKIKCSINLALGINP